MPVDKQKRKPKAAGRDLRRYAQTTQARLILGGLLILLVVGNGLIRWIYGPEALGLALLCSFVGLLPAVLIYGWLWIIERIVKRDRDV